MTFVQNGYGGCGGKIKEKQVKQIFKEEKLTVKGKLGGHGVIPQLLPHDPTMLLASLGQ
jgi:hypothetical protein